VTKSCSDAKWEKADSFIANGTRYFSIRVCGELRADDLREELKQTVHEPLINASLSFESHPNKPPSSKNKRLLRDALRGLKPRDNASREFAVSFQCREDPEDEVSPRVQIKKGKKSKKPTEGELKNNTGKSIKGKSRGNSKGGTQISASIFIFLQATTMRFLAGLARIPLAAAHGRHHSAVVPSPALKLAVARFSSALTKPHVNIGTIGWVSSVVVVVVVVV